jgi:hypothetical protein
MKWLPALMLLALLASATTHAGNNAGTLAYLSWSSSDHTTTNIASGPANNLFRAPRARDRDGVQGRRDRPDLEPDTNGR